MVSKERKIIFLLPPKTASNSLVQTLMNNGFTPDSQSKKYTVSKIHLKLDEIMDRYDIESLEGYKVIQVTRNPYDRIISSYFHQMRIFRAPDFRANISIRDYKFDQFLRHLNLTINSENFIEDFYGDAAYINYVIENKRFWAGTRFYHTQSSWKNVDCDFHHFKLENLTNDITPIESFVYLSLPPLIKFNFNPDRIDYEKYKTESNKEIIRDIFSIDFDTFSY